MNVRKWGGYWAQTAGVLAIVVSIVNLVVYFDVITLTKEMLVIFLVGFLAVSFVELQLRFSVLSS